MRVRSRCRRLAAAAAIACVAALAQAQSGDAVNPRGIVELRDGSTSVDALPYSLIALEKDGHGQPQQLSFEPDRRTFSDLSGAGPLALAAADAVWISFTVRSAASARSWLIEAGPASLDSVSVYLVDPDGRVEGARVDSFTRSDRARRAISEFCFRLTIGPDEVKTVYMRFAAEGPLSVNAKIWDSFAYLRSDEANSMLVGFSLGVIVAVFIYTFFIALSLREGAYAYYLVYLAALGLLVVVQSGPGSSSLRLGAAWAARRAIPFYSSIMGFGMALFSRRFLEMKRRAPPLSAALLAVAAVALPFDLALATLELRSIVLAGVLFDAAAKLVILAAAVYAVATTKRRREAYFLIGWLLAIAGTVIARLDVFGIVDASGSMLLAKAELIGAVLQILILSYGITEAINAMRAEKEAGQRRSIELLERANRVKEDFVIGTSLEFRSPLYGMIGLVDSLEGLSKERATPEEQRITVLVRAEAQRLLGLVSNVAAYARLRNGDIAVRAERVSLREMASDIAASVAHIASGKDIGIESDVEDIEFESDGRLLSQIAFNVFSDAVKRSPSGVIRLTGRRLPPPPGEEGDRVLFAVTDSAPPLPADQLARLHSVGADPAGEGVGPGLPLLVARFLARRLGGELRYSWASGRGRFELELPLELSGRPTSPALPRSAFLDWFQARPGRLASADLSESPQGPSTRGLVLAYDEDPVFLESLKRYLEGRGYAVAPTVSADNVVSLASTRRFDLVLLDASSPSRAGLVACARIRAMRPLGELPVVVMTDRDSAEAVEAAFRSGATDYMPKLAPNELLFARVDTIVALRRSIDERLETRRRIAELEKLKTLGVLAAGVAHEVNTPNNAVIRNMPILSEIWRELAPSIRRLMDESSGFDIGGWSSSELMDEVPALLSDTYNAGLQIKKIVEDLKDYARDSSYRPPEAVDLSAVAAYAARLLQPLVAKSTRSFELVAPEGLPPVWANPQKLTQVAVNILENALQSLPGPESAVRLSCAHDEARDLVVLECADEGVGIDRAARDKVFEPFFTTKRDSGGTGLGLSVAIGIVRDAGGDIAIESTPGAGTVVRVELPAARKTELEDDERRA